MAALPFNMRVTGCNPMIVADDASLEFMTDPYSASSAHATIGFRHACNVFFRVSEIENALGGGVAISSAIPGYYGATVESMRLTTDGGVRVPGTFHATSYCNLVDNFDATTLTQPTSARALNQAFHTLSNLVVSHVASVISAGGTSTAMEALASSNDPYSSNLGVISGPIVCTDLHVIDGGRVVATNYAGLGVDYLSTSMIMPPSQFALYSAVTDMSNIVFDAVKSVKSLVDGGGPFATDSYLVSVDGHARLQFVDGGPTGIAAYAPSNASPLVRVVNNSNNNVVFTVRGDGGLVVYSSDGATSVLKGISSDAAAAGASEDSSNIAVSHAVFAEMIARIAALEALNPPI